MTSRRSVLRSAGTLGVTVSTAGLAGCTYDVGDPGGSAGSDGVGADGGDDNSTGSDRRDDDDGSQRDRDQPDATAELAALRADMGALIDDLHEVAHDPDVAVEDRDLRARVDEFRPRLEELAGRTGSEEQADQHRLLHRLYRLLDRLVGAMEGLSKSGEIFGAALDTVETEDFEEIDRQLERANEEIPRLGRARDQLTEIQPDIDEFDEIDGVTLEETVERLGRIVQVIQGLQNGMRTWARGYEFLLDALTAYDEGRYPDVRRPITRAESAFSQAATDFRATLEGAPSDFKGDLEIFLCLFESFADAARHYGNAARAFREGDEETGLAEEERGNEALDRCG